MEIPEEVEVCNKDHSQIMKGKRTKRQRPSSPTCSSGFDFENTSTTTSADFRDSTQEEEDMANCLILLAQGRTARKASDPVLPPPDLYQCKTCNRCFPSFQALGGHRASHKKSEKLNTDPEKQAVTFVNDSYDPSLSLRISNSALYSSTGKSKVHECSICGAEFSSGQALGGHMRRHRTLVNASTSSPESQEAKKPRSVLKLDLNLPAPEDDPREPKFAFQPKQNALVFSASSLVDCHY